MEKSEQYNCRSRAIMRLQKRQIRQWFSTPDRMEFQDGAQLLVKLVGFTGEEKKFDDGTWKFFATFEVM